MASDARATASAVACGRVGYVASFDARLDAPRALEPRARGLDAPAPARRAHSPTARCLRATTRETLAARAEEDESDGFPRGNALAVREDASTRDRETGTLWAARADGDGGERLWVARARRERGVDGGVRLTAESHVRFESRVVEVDVADGGYRGHRAMAGVCARTRRGAAALLRARETTDDAGEPRVEVMEVAKTTGGDGIRDGVVCVRAHPSWMDECAYARANGTVGTLGVDGERDARERDDRRGASDWYGVAYGAHPRTLLYADRSTVEFVDLRTRRGESRAAHDARGDEAFRAVSRAREHYYALASATTTTASLTTSFVEIRDARRARDPVVRWEHQGFRTPTTLRVVDTTEWRERDVDAGAGAFTIFAFTPGDAEVYLYDCATYANERRGHSGEQICATSYGSSVRLPTASGAYGFDACRLGETRGGLFWLDDDGAWEQTYVIDAAESSSTTTMISGASATRAMTALRFEHPRAPPKTSKTRDVVVARADDAEDDEPERAFADVPHLYEYVVHGNLPRADVRNDAREGDGGDEAATLHAAFSDGWRMNASELLECGEYLLRDGASSASLAIDDWRRSRWQPDSSKPYKRPTTLRATREIENPLAATREDADARRRWRDAVVAEDVLPIVADALKDYASNAETGETKFTRRLVHASKCLEFASAEAADAVGSPCDVDGDARDVDASTQSLPPYDSLSESFAMSQAVSQDVDQDAPFAGRLLARWVPETRRRRESDDFASMPPPRPRFR